MRFQTLAIGCALTVVLLGCDHGSGPSFRFIDSYLANMDRFVQGGGSMSRLNEDAEKSHTQLALSLAQRDKRAPGRMVFYVLMQGRGFIPYETDLGRACESLFAGEVPLSLAQAGMHIYSARDVYRWWERHKSEYEPFPPYDAWRQREHVKNSVIPMYESTQTNKPAA